MSPRHASQHSSKSATGTPRPSQMGTHLEFPGQSVRPTSGPPIVGTSSISARERAAGGGYRQSGAHLDGSRSSQSNKPLSAAGLQAPSAQRTSNAPRSEAARALTAPASHHSQSQAPMSRHSSHHSNAAASHHTGTSRALVHQPFSSSSYSSSQQRPTGALLPYKDQRGVGMKWKAGAKSLAPLRPGEKRQYMEVVTTTARIVQEWRD
ncbi:hypothetical protein HBH70_031560 [Parastagonospora nodorum]|nr:hypothetical protein HBH49_110440 [Parastagonospora nodorum]KAH4604533.1 hypothetical protein HBH82_134080 [Parastagonospora nodorum]KAH4690440.1 hypothetical protein HBH78_088720 [Parastagonospora nodorum]KAH4705251.1 hypothetical protein HBH67_092350 [Parastagonospora nodorum]KAH4780308.1 hypothetical protein HBH62_131910 [Parastagonospora nodorum]